ncbi:MAG: TetR family transcriptional regulator [Bacillota bacterium]
MDKKIIQKKRMMGYFLEAANKIIEEEGLEEITIRKVADLAGYNYATVYNYFENLDHLIFFACMKYLKGYILDLPNHIKNADNALDKYLLIWECFSKHSYTHPKIYYKMFFDKFSGSYNDAVKQYYFIFPEEIAEQAQDMLPTMLNDNKFHRDMEALKACAKEGFLKKESLEEINDMCMLIYEGMLLRMIHQADRYTVEKAVETTLRYIKQILKSFMEKQVGD